MTICMDDITAVQSGMAQLLRKHWIKPWYSILRRHDLIRGSPGGALQT